MDLAYTPKQQAFRAEVRSWLAANLPKAPLASYDTREGFEQHREWERRLFENRLSMVMWPEALGGRGCDLIEWLIFEEEYYAAGAPMRVNQNGQLLLGPTLMEFGSEAQKAKYLAALLSGRFFGTMALTEPQAGSSLSDLTTSATPQPDGTYRIKGSKIFISGGDHELRENIVHLVLARIPGAPPGVKGISLFTVPKFRVNADGSLGPRNDVKLSGLIHKAGWRGTTSTLLSFGDQDDCEGELVGQPHQGLACMFHMMNEARIGVGMGAVMYGYRGYLASLQYARERLQGRPPAAKDPLQPQVPLVAPIMGERLDIRAPALSTHWWRKVEPQAVVQTEGLGRALARQPGAW